LFDVFMMVDWSGSARPRLGRDSIWSCVLDAGTGSVELVNHPTRTAARFAIRDVLAAAANRRVLVGFDFPFGYPAGTAAAAGLGGPAPWRATWAHLASVVVDDDRNRNNRIEVATALNARLSPSAGPFWACPPRLESPALSTGKAPGFPHHTHTGQLLPEFRLTEQLLRSQGSHAFSVWQLLGAGSVGSQALLGIPTVAALCADPELSNRSRVWPFTTGFTRDPTAGAADAVVHAEIWPGAVPIDFGLHPVRDAAQVLSVCHHLAALDRTGRLGTLFAPPLSDEDVTLALAEEGWILGVGLSSDGCRPTQSLSGLCRL
jgi:precorrin-8X/cobalt-precorrin-8 methylmutase